MIVARNAVKTVARNVRNPGGPTTMEMAIGWTSTVTVGTLIAYPFEAAHGKARVAARLHVTALISCRGVSLDRHHFYPTYYDLGKPGIINNNFFLWVSQHGLGVLEHYDIARHRRVLTFLNNTMTKPSITRSRPTSPCMVRRREGYPRRPVFPRLLAVSFALSVLWFVGYGTNPSSGAKTLESDGVRTPQKRQRVNWFSAIHCSVLDGLNELYLGNEQHGRGHSSPRCLRGYMSATLEGVQ